MKPEPFNLDREFIKWFYEEPYPDENTNRRAVFNFTPSPNINAIDYWMREAFKRGAKLMAGETLCILSDWATACEGLNPELNTPSEVFDRAEYNLMHYYTQLELFEQDPQ